MTIAQLLRPLVERSPTAAACYRMVRDYLRFQRARAVELPQGFRLAGDRKMESGSYEAAESELIESLLSEVSVFVDVGANVGFYTCLARRAGARVVAVEPLERNLRYLYRNLLENGLDGVEVYPLGLGARPGLATLYGTNATASTVKGWSRASAIHSRTVPTSTLDLLLGERFARERLLIKIDVEGGERAVLDGARSVLARPLAPLWVVEIYLGRRHPGGANPVFFEIFELFWRHGYTARVAEPGGRLVERADVAAWVAAGASPTGNPNYLFRRENADSG